MLEEGQREQPQIGALRLSARRATIPPQPATLERLAARAFLVETCPRLLSPLP